jgi:gamma-glutamyltranspeptidase / glutathione hydrolase
MSVSGASATSEHGMVATSHPLAVEVALDALRDGGTSVDAAIAAGAMLTVVDPRSTGIGGDLFAQCWLPGAREPVGLAAAGPAPARMTMTALEERGFSRMPTAGPWCVTVPGSVAGWDALMNRFGRLGLERALTPAIDVAEGGFEVLPFIAEDWSDSVDKLSANAYSASLFLPAGRPPQAGEKLKNEDLGRSLRAIASSPSTFYTGWIAEEIDAAMRTLNGPLTAQDLASWNGPEWVVPIRRRFRDSDVYEMPPPTQGIVVLESLGLYEALRPNGRVQEDHAAIECVKLAVADAAAYVADPMFSSLNVEPLLSDSYLDSRRRRVDMDAARPASAGTLAGDTVYVAVTDREGGACSFIQSLFMAFGSGVGVPGTGIVLQNRGTGFTLEGGHPNSPEPRKRPFHTIIPATLGRDGHLRGVFGVVGGPMQPQGHFQVLRNVLDRRMDPQSAVAEPRFRVGPAMQVSFERSYDRRVVESLGALGHEPSELSRFEAGGAQLILVENDGFVAGSDPRKDGMAGGY